MKTLRVTINGGRTPSIYVETESDDFTTEEEREIAAIVHHAVELASWEVVKKKEKGEAVSLADFQRRNTRRE